MSLYLKYRPSSFEEIVGNEKIKYSLEAMTKKPQTCPHSFLLHGATGCGKTTIARILAKSLGCHENEIKELDSADFRGIDTVREIRKQSQYKPLQGSIRVWVLDECHKLTSDAMSALLKILEDTPKHIYFILCTTDPQKLLKTIKGRCSQFQVSPLNDKQMFGLLRKVVKAEDEKLQKIVYTQIIEDSQGHVRNALQILDQVLRVDSDDRLGVAKRTAAQTSQSIELCRALLQAKPWKAVKGLLKGLKNEEPEGIRRHIIGYAQSVLLNGENDQAALIIEEFYEPFYSIGFPGLVYCCYSVCRK